MNNPSRRHFLEGAAATIAGAAVLSSGTAEAAAKKVPKEQLPTISSLSVPAAAVLSARFARLRSVLRLCCSKR